MHRPTVSHISGLTRVRTPFANAWLVDAPGGWVLVDTGLPGYAGRIVHHAERRYGQGTRPHAIVLTHGHIDHAGSAARLASHWDVPVFAHRRELPYLDGRAVYRKGELPPCATIAQLARALPRRGAALRGRLRALPRDGRVPFLPGWTWLRTPEHTAGHVSLLRTSDRTLLSGDARLDPDFLAEAEPARIAPGHGRPLGGEAVFALSRERWERRRVVDRSALRAAAVGILALGAGLAFRSLRRVPA